MNEKRDEKIRKLHETGKFTLQEIGDRYDISRERVRQIVGSPDEPTRVNVARERRKRVLQLVGLKKSVKTICRELGENGPTIYNDIRKLGLNSVSPVEELLVQGLSRCYRCHQNKLLSEFTPSNPHTCRKCAYLVTSDWISKNRERHNASTRRYYYRNKVTK